MVAEIVYLLCAAASVACAVLLLRGYRQSRTRLLFWACLGFVGLALSDVVLFADLVLLPNIDLFYVRSLAALAGMSVLLYGLVWEVR